ncbi:MAG: Glycerol-3-phosphate 1-O-acyltransferase [Gemmatimonadetes bacterium]|nr:Glycerol-3-phosphate 1-O-acyltransferase [Gemmatimonadota bacterium]
MFALVIRRFFNRMAVRALRRNRARLDRFKLARRSHVRARLLADAGIAEAVKVHAAAQGVSEAEAWTIVERYVLEIVPFFNIIAYYHVGYRVAGWLLNLFYRVAVEWEDRDAHRQLPRDAVVVYLMNHRSNADYVLVSYALAGQVAISYAVGEWARAFPLEVVFKAFGSYFVRRRYREPLYHTVLERYVQLITREGVTQGIFLEGGLTRDGRLRAPKLGLLDYVLGIARDPGYAERLYIIPVAVNYDRVLEDRSLLRELGKGEGGESRPSRMRQMREVVSYLGWNVGRLLTRKWKRYGRAALTVGRPMPVAEWFHSHPGVFELPKAERLAQVQLLCDAVLERIGRIIPVTPVPLACAAIQSLGGDWIPRAKLVGRMSEMHQMLVMMGARVVSADRDVEESFERAWRMLRMRRMLVADGDGFAVIGRNRPLISYYANSIAHLLGPWADGVRARDSLPMERASL